MFDPFLMQSLAKSPGAVSRAKWLATARPAQLPPVTPWRIWLILAGRGFGKTRTGAEDAAWYGLSNPDHQIAVIAPTYNDVRGTCFEGVSGLLSCVPDACIADYNKTRLELRLTNGALFRGFSADTPDRLRGPQFHRAWCFIAGTVVETDAGPASIETIRPGDMVRTRKGFNRVASTSHRVSPVGVVKFSDGSFLVGTHDHPVYTARGWMDMGKLQEGDLLCALSALNGTGQDGTDITADITSARPRVAVSAYQCDSTGKFGGSLSDAFLMAMTFTTRMATKATTALTTWNFFRGQTTCATIAPGCAFQTTIGLQMMLGKSRASIADVLSFGFAAMRPCAKNANTGVPTCEGQKRKNASTAAPASRPSGATTALSVVSTWQPRGAQLVYCLRVDGASEYFANGVLVHNCDELAAWQYVDAWDQLMFGLRLGQDPRVIVTTTPRPTPLIRSIAKSPDTHITRGSTFDNAAHLAPTALAALREKYEGTRLGRQELFAEILDDVPGALWTRDMIRYADAPPDMARVIVAVDPSGASGAEGEGADSIGIVVAGRGIDGRFYVIEDATCSLGPAGWGRRAVERWRHHDADRIVAERNFGGAMVESVLRTAGPEVPVKLVTASRGKSVRAEPIAALYEQGRVSHVRGMDLLEDQMMQMTGTGFVGQGSPDRVDALVWALSELALDHHAAPRIRTL